MQEQWLRFFVNVILLLLAPFLVAAIPSQSRAGLQNGLNFTDDTLCPPGPPTRKIVISTDFKDSDDIKVRIRSTQNTKGVTIVADSSFMQLRGYYTVRAGGRGEICVDGYDPDGNRILHLADDNFTYENQLEKYVFGSGYIGKVRFWFPKKSDEGADIHMLLDGTFNGKKQIKEYAFKFKPLSANETDIGWAVFS